MARPELPTLPTVETTTVLAIGCSPALVRRCSKVAARLHASVRTSDVAGAPTAAAAEPPVAMVVPAALHAFDPKEFDDLARDVRARLVLVHDDIAEAVLEAVLDEVIEDARQHPSDPSVVGRYTIVDGKLTPPAAPRGTPPSRSSVRPKASPSGDVEGAPPASSGKGTRRA
jgi:hypothetical protein